VRRALYGFAATVLALTGVLQLVRPGSAYAYGQITTRSITMSSSKTGDTSVAYQVRFDPGTNATTVKSIAVDFCANTPIIGDSCTGTVGTSTPDLSSVTVTTTGAGVGNLTGGTWTVATTNSGRTFTISNSTGMIMNTGTSYFFTINLVTNPTTLGTFYGRILTFPNDVTSNYAGGYTGTNLGANIPTDAGGIAISTANQITITAKVQERIVFCVYTTGTGNNCTSKSGSAVNLGDVNGVLDPTGPYVDKNAKYTVSTNAASGVAIRVKGPTPTSGSNTIDPNLTPATSAFGTEQFGLCTYQSASVAGGLAPTTKYDGGTGAECSGTTQSAGTGTTGGDNSADFTFDTNATNGTTSTYGDVIANKSAGDFSTGTLVFIGNVSNATEAGIYVTTLTFIATGTY
jgi:hypothetical protein